MEWKTIKTDSLELNLPNHQNQVLVTDGYGSCAVAWFNNGIWHASDDLILAENHDGGCHITIESKEIRYWTEIDLDSCPFPDWED